MIGRVVRRLRKEGLGGVTRVIGERYREWQSARLDRRFGIDTAGLELDVARLGGAGDILAHGKGYEPIQVDVFARMVQALGVEPVRFAFVDFGSGKGRALVLAAEAGFGESIGVEFSAPLHEQAQRNLQAYRRRRPAAPPVSAVQGDAMAFVPPPRDAVLFVYNTFDAEGMARLFALLGAHWRGHRRDWRLLYRNPQHAEVADRQAFLSRQSLDRSFGIWRFAD